MNIQLTQPTHFCLFRMSDKEFEIGLASSLFEASSAWCESDEAFNQTKCGKFGWIDQNGKPFTNQKYSFERPTTTQILTALSKHPELLKKAIIKGSVLVIKKAEKVDLPPKEYKTRRGRQ